jgi:serine/threonine protein kinase
LASGVPDDDDPSAPASAAGTSPTTMGGVIRAIARVEPLPTLAPGQVLERTYELSERLGGGGMGVVFRARDLRLGRDVAIKVLRPTEGDEERLRRLFEREARATAQLLHPNIITLHHVGEHAGSPYLVLELLSGETLSARLARRGRLQLPEALRILDAVLGALEFAHVRGVLHRDLKPNNVFITGDERIKVLDLGVSLSLGAEAGPATLGAGTPGYMAPEQRTGGEQDARTDVWAAALLLLECLLGRLPDEDAVRAVRHVDAPPAFLAVLARALATDPAQRPPSADELRRALARAGEPPAPSASPPVPQARPTLAFLVIALVAAALGAGVMYWAMR